MECCELRPEASTGSCPGCDTSARTVELVTVKSLLTARALERLVPMSHYFCPEGACEVVYFSEGSSFSRDEVRVPVFQKEAAGQRLVCYCFEITEDDADTEAESRVRSHVRAGRCACELKNPEGKCCLANLRAAIRNQTEVSQFD